MEEEKKVWVQRWMANETIFSSINRMFGWELEYVEWISRMHNNDDTCYTNLNEKLYYSHKKWGNAEQPIAEAVLIIS